LPPGTALSAGPGGQPAARSAWVATFQQAIACDGRTCVAAAEVVAYEPPYRLGWLSEPGRVRVITRIALEEDASTPHRLPRGDRDYRRRQRRERPMNRRAPLGASALTTAGALPGPAVGRLAGAGSADRAAAPGGRASGRTRRRPERARGAEPLPAALAPPPQPRHDRDPPSGSAAAALLGPLFVAAARQPDALTGRGRARAYDPLDHFVAVLLVASSV
jgi:hypothetical protein